MALPLRQRRDRRRPQEIFSGVWIDELKDSQAPLVAKELLGALLERLLAHFLADAPGEIARFLAETSFSGQVRLSYLLGLISAEEAADLHLVEAIRNEFSRSLGEVSFEDESVGEMVDRLETARQFREHPDSLGHARDRRMRFNSAVHILARYLDYRVHERSGRKIGKRALHPPFRYAPPGEPPPVGGS